MRKVEELKRYEKNRHRMSKPENLKRALGYKVSENNFQASTHILGKSLF